MWRPGQSSATTTPSPSLTKEGAGTAFPLLFEEGAGVVQACGSRLVECDVTLAGCCEQRRFHAGWP